MSVNPGSVEARVAGCLCPVLDNSYGKGHYGQPNVFVINANCPLHGQNNAPIRVRFDLPPKRPLKWASDYQEPQNG